MRDVIFAFVIMFLGFSSVTVWSDEGADLSFISAPIIDGLVEKLVSDDQERVIGWLAEDDNFSGVSGKVIQLMKSGKIGNYEGFFLTLQTETAEALLIESGVPAGLLGAEGQDGDDDPLVRLLAEVSEEDGKNISLYFETFPQMRSSFSNYVTTNSLFKSLEMVGFPFSQSMKDSMAAAELKASREKYLKLIDPSKVEAFCEELAQSGSGIGASRVFSAGTTTGFFIAPAEDYYGMAYKSMPESQKAEMEATNPLGLDFSRYLMGPLDGLMKALQSDGDINASLMMQKNVGMAGMFGGGRKRQRIVSDNCALYAGAYLQEIGL